MKTSGNIFLFALLAAGLLALTSGAQPVITNQPGNQTAFLGGNLTYQLQTATNLAAPVWTDLGSPVTATNTSAATAASIGTNSQQFYRLRSVP